MSFLERVCKCLDGNNVSYAIVGGYAVALHGAPRGTIDIDLIVSFKQDAFVAVERAMNSMGLQSRLPVTAKEIFQFRREYIEERNLIAWSFYNPKNPIEMVDVIITNNLDDYNVVEKKHALGRIKIISKADLILMKKASGRKQDLVDVEALEKI